MRSNYTFFFAIILCLFTCVSCKDNTSSIEAKSMQLVLQKTKTFTLDNETAFDRLEHVQITKIEGANYYSFYNRNNHSICIYNYDTGLLNHKVALDKEGANAVVIPYGTFQYIIKDLNTIIINTIKFVYEVNKNGKILKKAETDVDDIVFNTTINFDSATHFENDKLHISLTSILPKENESNPLRAVFDFNTGKLEHKHIENNVIINNQNKITERIRKWMDTYGGLISISKFYAGSTDALYITTTLNDSIHLFNNRNLQQKFYAGDPEIVTANYTSFFDKFESFLASENGQYEDSKSVNCAYYTNMLMSPDKKWIYRILIHGTKNIEGQDSNSSNQEVHKASLIVFNIKTRKSHAYNIPLDNIYLPDYQSNIFITEEGIHFEAKDPKDENEKQYLVFNIQ